MRAGAAIFVVLALAVASRAADETGVELTPGTGEGEWKTLIASLAAKGDVVAPFVESRHFPFRRDPTVLEGVLRVSPVHGLSLEYTRPEQSVLIADSRGLVLRGPDGRSRELSSGTREAGAVAALLQIMRFDLAALYPQFRVRARGTGGDWRFDFEPRDPGVARSLGGISVAGSGTEVRRLEFRRSSSQWVGIEVGQAQVGRPFSPAEIARYFR